MITFINDYQQRVEEISTYFTFIKFIDNIETHKKQPLQHKSNNFLVERNLQKILRANAYLLLYNLVESTIRNSIQLLHDKINDDEIIYDKLSERIQEIWLNTKLKSLTNSNSGAKICLKKIITGINEAVEFSSVDNSINISGNLDYDNIQQIINKFGFFGKINGSRKDISQSVNKIKYERNKLAHGNKRFCESGEIITYNELNEIKDNIILFLNDYTTNVSKYMTDKKYLK